MAIQKFNLGAEPTGEGGDVDRVSWEKASANFKYLDENKLGKNEAAGSAKKLETPFLLNGVEVDGSANITIPTSDITKEYVDTAASTAESNAKTAAAQDASGKANSALSSSKSYTDQQIGNIGTTPINKGGTGATNATSARTNLDVYSKTEVTQAISNAKPPDTGTTPINKGGTGADTAEKARTNLDVPSNTDLTQAIAAIPKPQTYTLPTASTTTKGGVKVGTGLSIAAEALSIQFASQTEANAGIDDAKAITSKKMNEAVKNQLNATGSAPTFACRAWVNFEGGTTPIMRANGNILSVSRASTGVYTVRFLTPIYSDYSVVHGLNVSSSGKAGGALSISNMTSSGFDVNIWNNTWNPSDPYMASFGVFSK
ncbi:hypothetical protein [Acinetobacter pullicarnis]|uniref:hypothetical protein n=1 Tax=Acinetobacter pullicarnis TaxID=2576829 RepID=UPI001120693E|nr:hypothetical protein [Acinetobacter pullicarnis]